MGRVAAPRAVQKLRPDYKNNTYRYKNEPPDGAGELKAPPAHFNAAQKRIWEEIVSDLPMNVATQSDHILIEMTTVLLYQFRESPEDFTAAQYGRLIQCLGRLGMTPSDRTAMANKGYDKNRNNPFDGF